MSTPEHRASDAEREAVADRLREAAGDGRLDADELAAFLTANVVCWAIWLATGASAGVWPKWVLLGTGLAVVITFIRLVVGPEGDEDGIDAPR